MSDTRVGLKWTYHEDEVLAAWVAEMDFGLAPAISEALHRAVDEAVTGYPYPEAEKDVARAATAFWRDRFGWEVDPTWVFSAPDVVEGIRRAITHLTRPGSPVVLHSPVYYPFYGMVERTGRTLLEVPSRRDADGRYRLDLDGIAEAVEGGAGSVVLCNPWNPTGRVFTEEELDDLLVLARRHDARIISDEIHSAITYSGVRHTPMAMLDTERVVTVTSASKAWNLPGLKCAQVVLTGGSDRETWEDFFTMDKVGVGTFGLLANQAAYASGVSWFDDVRSRLEDNRDLLIRLISDQLPAAVVSPPEGTYLAWIDMTAYGLTDPAAFCLDRARVALTGGGPFGRDAGQFVRFNFATDAGTITEIVERMAGALPPG